MPMGLGRPRPARCAPGRSGPRARMDACLDIGFQGSWFPSLPLSQSSQDGFLTSTSSPPSRRPDQPRFYISAFPPPAGMPSVGHTCWTPPYSRSALLLFSLELSKSWHEKTLTYVLASDARQNWKQAGKTVGTRMTKEGPQYYVGVTQPEGA